VPELPDIALYLKALETRIVGKQVTGFTVRSMSVLRTYHPPYDQVIGKTVTDLRRIGKRIVWEFEEQLFLVIHLMVAGRLRWHDRAGVKPPGKVGLAAWGFPGATLVLTEQGSKRRAGIWVISGQENLMAEDRGGLEPLDISATQFASAIRERNHTLKRALTSQNILSGIGNAYSDEILWEARLSPVKQTSRLTDREADDLHAAVRRVLSSWIERLAAETGDRWPKRVTAFRPEMAVHGKFGEPCPRCSAPVQRIVYASNETNYCAACQTGGKLLADRSLSRLLKKDWPKTLEEMEGLREPGGRS
jgi:formamidopyrimidine-DNA glycosylase